MKKPKILLLADVPGWCFDNCCNEIIKHLSGRYDFTKAFIFNNGIQIDPIDHSPYDLVFRFIAYRLKCTENVPKHKLLTSIRSHNSVERRLEDFTSEVMTKTYNAVSVVAKGLRVLLPQKCCPIVDTQNGVDTELFKPIKDIHDFTIGFAGYSKHPNKKGVELIVEAAKLAGVKCKLADRNVEWLPHEKMPQYYKDIDVYICMSLSEGMPNSVLEAAAMGLPVISTRVDGVLEIIEHGKTGLLIDRSVPVLVEAIQLLKRDKDLYDFMSKNTRDNIVKNWTWAQQVKKYQTFFDLALLVEEVME